MSCIRAVVGRGPGGGGDVSPVADNALVTEPVIRVATTTDLPAIAAIYAHYVEHSVATFDETAPTLQLWTQKLADVTAAGWPFLVTESDSGTVAGYAFVKPYHDRPAYRRTVENSIYLHPDHTGRGLGRPLLRALLDAVAEAGAREVVAAVADTGSPASIELHTALGFRQVGTLTGVGRKHRRWIDVSLLQCSLAHRAR